MKICGFNAGLFGDLILNTTLCKTVKELYPDSQLTFCWHRDYANILPLFYNHPNIDNFHILEGKNMDDYPCQKDLDFYRKENFDIIYTPLPQHLDNFWYRHTHMADEIHNFYNLPHPTNKQAFLNKWFNLLDGYDKVVTASVFASGNHPNQLARTFSLNKIIEIFDNIEKLGYRIIRLDTRFEAQLEEKYPASKLSILDATKTMLSSKLHITCDTSFAHIASAYSHNTVSWTQYEAYNYINPNGYCFVSGEINNISIEEVIEKIKEKI